MRKKYGLEAEGGPSSSSNTNNNFEGVEWNFDFSEMDAREFVKLSVSGLGLRITPTAGRTSSSGKRRSKSGEVGATSDLFHCEIRFLGFQSRIAPVPLVFGDPDRSLAANFYIEANAFEKLFSAHPTSCLVLLGNGSAPAVELVLYAGRLQATKNFLGTFRVPVLPDWTDGMLLHSGWVNVGVSNIGRLELHSIVRVESDPRYEFQFDGDVALSPQIVQVNGNGTGKKQQQPVFSCKFSKGRTRMVQGDLTPSRTPREESSGRERRGWLVTIHDLSGSPIAAASMVTPFVPFTGSDEVSRSNPGGWLILVPDSSTMDSHGHSSYYSWRAWGRLEAWKQGDNRMGLKFQLISHTGSILVSETSMPSNKGGEFSIDTGPNMHAPLPSPHSSGDCSFYLGLPTAESGFVMSCELRRGNSGRNKSNTSSSSRATVQLSTKYITCVEDAAVFMALAAAVDLSRDACQPFSRKLRKELCRDLL